MASMIDIKRRKSSIQNTQQITKAMKLISSVKLQKARKRAEEAKPYFEYMYQTVLSSLARSGDLDHPYLKAGNSAKKAVIAVTSNRGLAGGYNNNIIKLVNSQGFKKEDVLIYAIGKKGRDAFERYGYEVKSEYSEAINEPIYKDASRIAMEVLYAYRENNIGEICLAYTAFKNTVVHEPVFLRLLPVDVPKGEFKKEEKITLMNYEPSEEEVLNLIIPKYITSLVYGALIEAAASENSARMQAMDSASTNADEMIEDLSLLYNRARQDAITQELTEIIAGAEALS